VRREGCTQRAAGRLVGRGAVVALALAACAEKPAQHLVVEQRIEWCAAGPFSKSLEEVRASQWTLVIHEGQARLSDPQPTPRLSEIVPRVTDIDLDIELLDLAGDDRIDGDVGAAIYEGTNESFQPDEAVDRVWVRASVAPPTVGMIDRATLDLFATTPTGEDLRLGEPSDLDAAIRCQYSIVPFSCRILMPCDPGGPTFRTRVVLERGEVVLDLRNLPGDHADGVPPSWAFMRADVRIDEVEVVEDGYDALFFSPKAWDGGDGTYGVMPADGLGALGCGIVVGALGTEEERAALVDCDFGELEALAIVAVERETV
jgi:hypothetical protein